jgi:hypothetical protein
MRRAMVAVCAVVLAALGRLAIADESFVEFAPSTTHFEMVQGHNASGIYVDKTDWAGVARAAVDLREDINRVTGKTPVWCWRKLW